MPLYLIVYDRPTGTLVEYREFASDQRPDALVARVEAEAWNRTKADREVVLLAASSRENLERTRARYFRTVGELASQTG